MPFPHRLRELTLEPARHPRGQPHLSSASGLVRAGEHLYVVADDEQHLASLDARDPAAAPLELVRFAPGSLPRDFARRKAAKPDLETLIHWPASDATAQPLLVAWGSASRPQRERAFVFALDERGALAGAPRELSLERICIPLRTRYAELNFEAGFVQGEHFHLFQRAHGGQPVNGHVLYPAIAVHAWLRGIAAHPPQPLSVQALDLGAIAGVPLGITDAAPCTGGGFVFTAVAEDTSDAYRDGACVGSVIGQADAQGRVQRVEVLPGAPKVEGVAIAGRDTLWLVTDADDPARASQLLEVHWPA